MFSSFRQQSFTKVRTPSARARLMMEAMEDRTTPTATSFDPYTLLPLDPQTGLVPGIVVADFTGDGRPDIAAGYSADGVHPARFAIFPSTGTGGTFGPPQTFDAGTGSYGGQLATGDFNNDGHPDLVLTAGGSNALGFGNRVSINLGDGAGGFASPIVFTTGGSDAWVIVADFNEDHNADLAIYTRDSGTMALHFGDGTGHFSSPATLAVAQPNQEIGQQHMAADLNGDGHIDLAVPIADGSNVVKTYFGTGHGTFSAGPILALPIGTVNAGTVLGIVAADLDEDGFPDLAVGAGAQVYVFRGTGGGSFTATPAAFPALSVGQAGVMDAADFDGDGHLDLIVGNQTDQVVAVLPGDGHGNLAPPESYAVRAGSGYDLRAADLNGDGRPDIVATSMSNTQPGVSVLINRSNPISVNTAPTATAGGPYTTTYGGALTLDGAGSTDPDGDVLTYTWTVNGHDGAATGISSALTWNDLRALGIATAGNYTVRLTVDDGHGGVNTSSEAALTVGKAISVVILTGGSFIYDGQPHPAAGSVAGVLIGDATEQLGTPTFSYSYTDDNGNVVTSGTAPVEPGYYTVTASFVGDNNYEPASTTTEILIAFEARSLTDLSKAFHAGRTIPIKIELTDAAGNNVSVSDITLTAIRLQQVNDDGSRTEVSLQDAGGSNPGGLFRYDAALGGYIFNLSTKGLTAGTYAFDWVAAGDPTEHELGFQLV